MPENATRLKPCIFINLFPKKQQCYSLAYLSNFPQKCNEAYLSNFASKCNEAITLHIKKQIPQNATNFARNRNKSITMHIYQILSQNATNFAPKCNKNLLKNATRPCVFIIFCLKMEQGYYTLVRLSNFAIKCKKG